MNLLIYLFCFKLEKGYLNTETVVIDFSAGNGNFVKELDSIINIKTLILVEPLVHCIPILKLSFPKALVYNCTFQTFCTLILPSLIISNCFAEILFYGNPPFSLAYEFIRLCMLFSDICIFLLPSSFVAPGFYHKNQLQINNLNCIIWDHVLFKNCPFLLMSEKRHFNCALVVFKNSNNQPNHHQIKYKYDITTNNSPQPNLFPWKLLKGRERIYSDFFIVTKGYLTDGSKYKFLDFYKRNTIKKTFINDLLTFRVYSGKIKKGFEKEFVLNLLEQFVDKIQNDFHPYYGFVNSYHISLDQLNYLFQNIFLNLLK